MRIRHENIHKLFNFILQSHNVCGSYGIKYIFMGRSGILSRGRNSLRHFNFDRATIKKNREEIVRSLKRQLPTLRPSKLGKEKFNPSRRPTIY